MITVLNGKSAPLRMPNAAPLLSAWVMSKKPGITVTLSCSGSDARTIALVPWSTATISSGRMNSSSRGGGCEVSPAATVSSSALSIDGLGQRFLAAVAQAGDRRVGRHRRHDPPAAFALHPGRTFDGDAGHRFARSLDVGRRRAQLDLGDDEKHRQLLGVLFEQDELPGRRGDDDLGLQGAADLLVLAERLDFGEHALAQRDQRLP